MSVEGFCAVEDGDTLSDKDATFSFVVTVSPGYDEPTTLDYAFSSNKSLEGYTVNSAVIRDSSDVTVLTPGQSQGSFELAAGVERFQVDVTVTADEALTGDERLTLTVADQELTSATGSASLADDACLPKPPPEDECPNPGGRLYLLMDQSTSMLGTDPSTEKADVKNRLEAQNRVAFHSFVRAATEAGWGFRLKGETDKQNFGPQTTANIINNSTEDLASALANYELIDNPTDDCEASAFTVHLIKFGYVVDHGVRTFTPGDPVDGSVIADSILLTTTPDQIYGNSIEGNSTWDERKLPDPDRFDFFRGDDTLSSNLYSGTEMLGALKGLQKLLKKQRKQDLTDADDFTYIAMATDGRPERRSWWDNREWEMSGDDVTGEPIPLPKSLGGTKISSSGLNYDAEGNPVFVLNNKGKDVWSKTQKKLNKALNKLAKGVDDPYEQLQVRAIGMGDGSRNVDFPTIYEDLYGDKTFDPSKGNWSYAYETSFGLPDFLG